MCNDKYTRNFEIFTIGPLKLTGIFIRCTYMYENNCILKFLPNSWLTAAQKVNIQVDKYNK